MFRPLSGCLIGGSSRQHTNSEIRPSGTLRKKIHGQPNVSVIEATDERPEDRRQPEHRAEQRAVLGSLLGRVEVRDDGEGDREDRAAAEALQAAARGRTATSPG